MPVTAACSDRYKCFTQHKKMSTQRRKPEYWDAVPFIYFFFSVLRVGYVQEHCPVLLALLALLVSTSQVVVKLLMVPVEAAQLEHTADLVWRPL